MSAECSEINRERGKGGREQERGSKEGGEGKEGDGKEGREREGKGI